METDTNKRKRTKNIPVQTYLSDEENDRLLGFVSRSGLSKSMVIRRLIMEAEIKEMPSLEARAILVELNRIGNNLNQIAAVLNAGLGFNAREYESNYRRLMEVLDGLQMSLYGE